MTLCPLSIATILYRLPSRIFYKGFVFTLAFVNDKKQGHTVGYFLTGIETKNKKKREAFKNGFWVDNTEFQLTYTNFLVIRHLWELTDEHLQSELNYIENYLNTKGLIDTYKTVEYAS